MALRNILTDNDPTLRKKSREVTDFNERLHILLDDMRQTLTEENGLGLAAPQVGILRRAAIIIDPTIEDESGEEQMIELINPVMITHSDEQTGIEGCLSFPGEYGIVTRPNFVEIRAQDRFGNFFSYTGEEIVARAICHELDHLNGLVFVDLVKRLLSEEEIQEYIDKMEAKKANHTTR